ncbi:transmembrane protein 44 isoform X2 [Equus quagga]|uniref:transmembrane protein 44 isoform X2 n=1 Tax=Equus quagga TaxID=89248 RepID=UPI001EE25CDA|nr:transmembrane protein 44 isoform X2 [Equus quagga]
MGEAPSPAPAPSPSPAPALWDWDYLDRCFARHRVCISFGLWICSSSCWIAAHALLLYLRCSKKPRRDQTAPCAACCLLTSLCDTVGGILARQLTIQVFTGAYLAAVDLVNFVFILFPVCGSRYKPNSGRGSRERKRKRRLRASLFALALPLSLGPGWALWAAVPKASGLVRGPQRRLLGSFLQCRGRTFPSIHLWTRLLSALAGLLYASAIVAHDRRPEYLLRATPWFLTSLGRASLDLAIIFLSCVMKSKMRRALGFTSEARGSPDTQALLTCAEKEQENEEARNENTDWVPLTTLPRCKSLRTMAAISPYMELTIEPVQQVSFPHHGCWLLLVSWTLRLQRPQLCPRRSPFSWYTLPVPSSQRSQDSSCWFPRSRLQRHQAARRRSDEHRRRVPAGAPLVPSRSGHPGPRVLQQLLRGVLHQLRPRGTRCRLPAGAWASSFTSASWSSSGRALLLAEPPLASRLLNNQWASAGSRSRQRGFPALSLQREVSTVTLVRETLHIAVRS